MKIFILANSCWNIYNFRIDLINHLAKNHSLYVLAPQDNYTKYIVEKKIEYKKLEIKNSFKYIFLDILYIIKLTYYIIKFKPDYVLSFTIKPNIYSAFVSKFFKFKLIINISGLGSSIIKKSFLKKIILLLYKISFKNVYHIFFQNKYDQRYFTFNKIINNKSKYSVIPGSGINTDNYKFSPQYPKEQRYIFIGRLIKDKGINELIESIKLIKKKYSNIKFGIIGMIDKNNPSSISKELLDRYIENKLFDYYSFSLKVKDHIIKSRAVILPSYREGTSKVLLESLSLGRPIIVSDVPGCKELVNNGLNGIISKKKNINSLTESIESFIKLSESQCIQMGKNGNKFVNDFYSVKIIIKEYSALINNL